MDGTFDKVDQVIIFIKKFTHILPPNHGTSPPNPLKHFMTHITQRIEDSPKENVTPIGLIRSAIDIPAAFVEAFQNADDLIIGYRFTSITVIPTNQIMIATPADDSVQYVLSAPAFKQNHIIHAGIRGQFFDQ
jgi:hypothetical protein